MNPELLRKDHLDDKDIEPIMKWKRNQIKMENYRCQKFPTANHSSKEEDSTSTTGGPLWDRWWNDKNTSFFPRPEKCSTIYEVAVILKISVDYQ